MLNIRPVVITQDIVRPVVFTLALFLLMALAMFLAYAGGYITAVGDFASFFQAAESDGNQGSKTETKGDAT